MIFGASLSDGLGLSGCDCEVVSRWGETTESLLRVFPTFDDYLSWGPYDIVILTAGTNDLANDATPHFAIDNLMRMHRKCKAARVSLSVGMTLIDDVFNTAYIRRCKMLPEPIPVCEFLNGDMDTSFLEDDGIHLNVSGKAALSARLEETVRPHLAARYLKQLPTKARNHMIEFLMATH